jgi:hypothetical protein
MGLIFRIMAHGVDEEFWVFLLLRNSSDTSLQALPYGIEFPKAGKNGVDGLDGLRFLAT